VFSRLDPFAKTDAGVREGFWSASGFGLLFFGLLYGVPTFLSRPFADHDYYFSITEIYRLMWLGHGHPLELTWFYGGGTWLPGLAQFPGTSPGVLISVLVGTVLGQIAWTVLQLGLGCGFAYGLLRTWGCNHRGAGLGAVLFWCSPWMVRHLAARHIPWAGFCFSLGLAWLIAAGQRLSTAQLALGALAAAWLLVSSSPFQGVFYGLPLLLGTALWAGRSEVRTPVVVLACLGVVLWIHRDFYANALEGFDLYERGRLLALQDQKLMGPGGAMGLALRTVAGLIVPFVGYGHHAEGNLLVFLPILLATGVRPGRGLALALGGVVLLGLVPALGPVRQMDRMLWTGVLLVGLHCGLAEAQISTRRLRLSLGLAFGIGAMMMGLRLVMQPLSPLEDRTYPEGITGLAVPTSQHPLQDGYAEGFFRSIRAGLVLPRPAAHVVIPPFPGKVDGFLVEDDRFTLEAREGHLLVRGPFVPGTGVTLSLRGDSRVRSLLKTSDPVHLENDNGRLRIVALEALDAVEITSR
jgi:hypothetical protein